MQHGVKAKTVAKFHMMIIKLESLNSKCAWRLQNALHWVYCYKLYVIYKPGKIQTREQNARLILRI